MAVIDSFDVLSSRLDALERELTQFHGTHHNPENSTLLRRLRARQAEIRARIADARTRGQVWEMIGLEFVRDFDALAAEVSAAIVGGADD